MRTEGADGSFLLFCRESGTESVSYTHLDVYKRQQFVLIYGASFLSESARHLILPYLGMSYRLNGQKELMVFAGSEIILIAALILAAPKWMTGKAKR